MADEAVRPPRRECIPMRYGEDYVPEKPNIYKGRKSAQDAHEAIRPTDIQPPRRKRSRPRSRQRQFKPVQADLRALRRQPDDAARLYDTSAVDIDSDTGARFCASTPRSCASRASPPSMRRGTDDAQEEANARRCRIWPRAMQGGNRWATIAEQHFTQPPAALYRGARWCKRAGGKGHRPPVAPMRPRFPPSSPAAMYAREKQAACIPRSWAVWSHNMMKEHFPRHRGYEVYRAAWKRSWTSIEDGQAGMAQGHAGILRPV